MPLEVKAVSETGYENISDRGDDKETVNCVGFQKNTMTVSTTILNQEAVPTKL